MAARSSLSALLAVGALVAVPVSAIEFRAGEIIEVGRDEVIPDDLYAVGGTVTVSGRVEGDVIASGREVRMNGEVTGDFMAAAQAVVVDGRVGDDVRMAGMALELGPAAAVGDDVIAAGLSLETRPESLAGGSLVYSGYQALLAGVIEGSLFGSMNALEIRGALGGDSEITVEGNPDAPTFVQYLPSPIELPAVPGGLTIADGARIDGELEYVSSREARGGGAGSGALARIEPPAEPVEAAGDAAPATRRPAWLGRMLRWAGLILLGLLLAWRTPGWLEARSGEIESKPLPLAGVGLVGLAALPVAVGLAFLTLIAVAMLFGTVKLASLAALTTVLGLAALGLVLLLFWLTAAYLAPVLVGLCAGRWALKRVAADRAAGLAAPLVAGLLLLLALRFVPILGFLVALAVLLLGWGAILFWLWQQLRRTPTAA